MLKPLPGVQRVPPPLKTERQNSESQKSASSNQQSLTDSAAASPLSQFLNAETTEDANVGEETSVSAESEEILNEVLTDAEAATIPTEHKEQVAELIEAVPELVIEKEQTVVFPRVATEPANGADAVVEINTPAETNGEPAEPVFVETSDIAKLISTGKNIWSYTGLELVETTVMLLKNGMAYTNLTGAPGNLEVPTSLEATDDNLWTTWHQDESGAIFLGSTDAAQPTPLVGDDIDFSPLTNADIAGTHTKVKSETWGASQITTWSDVTFNEDGTFEFAESELSTTGGAGSLLVDTFTSNYRHLSANNSSVSTGGQSQLSGPGDVIAISSTNDEKEPNKNMYGSYQLAEDGLSIELTFADGTVESRLIYKSDGYVHFGKSSYNTSSEPEDRLDFLRKLARGTGNDDNREGWLSVFADSAAAANRPSASQMYGAPGNAPVKAKS